MSKTLYLVRGLPGSGKSTLAQRLAPDATFEADQFFVVDGEFRFDLSKIKDAHESCFRRCREAMLSDRTEVVVSNTFARRHEMSKYQLLAEELGWRVSVIHMENHFGSTHGVPTEVLARMEDRWERMPRLAEHPQTLRWARRSGAL